MIELLDNRCRLQHIKGSFYACKTNMHCPKKEHNGHLNSDCIQKYKSGIDVEQKKFDDEMDDGAGGY